MDFDYDPERSKTNKAKHGIDFDGAQALWLDPGLLEAPARTEGEMRFLAIGRIEGRHWSAIFAKRGEIVRLISVRRSRKNEIERYESF